MTAAEALQRGSARLAAAGVDGGLRDARWLLAHCLDIAKDRLAGHLQDPISPEALARFERAIGERANRKPVSKIVGWKAFYGRTFEVDTHVLDPRPETEGLITHLLEAGPPSRVLDLGTGSGILAVTVLCECSEARAVATDISEDALAVARRNADRHGVGDRIAWRQTDWARGVEGRFDAILCNPPYIPEGERSTLARDVLDWDPERALFAGADGLDVYRTLAPGLWDLLTDGGAVLFETGAKQPDAVASILAEAAPFDIAILNELSGRPRFVRARRAAL